MNVSQEDFRRFCAGLSYAALFVIVWTVLPGLLFPWPRHNNARFLMKLAISLSHGVLLAYLAAVDAEKEKNASAFLSYLYALVIPGFILLSLFSSVFIAARYSDALLVLMYYVFAVPGYLAAYPAVRIARRRYKSLRASSRGGEPEHVASYCRYVILVSGLAVVLAFLPDSPLTVLVYTAIVAIAAVSAKLRLRDSVEAALAGVYMLAAIKLIQMLTYLDLHESLEPRLTLLLLYVVAPVAALVAVYFARAWVSKQSAVTDYTGTSP